MERPSTNEPKMNILYDHQIFTSQKYGGISRYFYELLKEFDSMQEVQTTLSLVASNNHYISDKKFVNYINFLPNHRLRGKQLLFAFLNKKYSISKLKQQNFDLFHPTYYDPYFLPYLQKKPFVLTVHDMIYEKYNKTLQLNDSMSEHKRLLVDKATKIIAISENTKKDLIELFGTDDSKIKVIYHGSSMYPTEQATINVKIPNKYLLFVGVRGGYKNFDNFIRAIAPLLNQDKELSIVCAGGGMFAKEEKELFNQLKISKQIFQKDLDDDSLAFLYQNALFFVFPSLYEGFGIPMLEAFASKCPIACSNTSSFPEIAADAAIYFNPNDKDSIQQTVALLLHDTTLRANLITKGIERLKYFSWEKTISETKKFYESVL